MTTPSGMSFPLPLSVRAQDAKLELEAATLLARVRRELGLAAVPLPVPIDAWIERPLGFEFSIVGDDQLASGVLGLARPTRGEILVHESVLAHEGRFRFTCAHELAHCLLHRDIVGELVDEELPRSADVSKIEREADRFAAALLMPFETISSQLGRAMADHGLAAHAVQFMRGDDVRAVWLWRRCLVPQLAEAYGASRAAVAYRMREIRIPGGRRLVRPSLVPLIAAPERAVAALPLDRVRIVAGVPGIDP